MPEILIINHYANPGSGRHFQLGRELVKRGHTVTIAAASFQPKTGEQRRGQQTVDGVRFVLVPDLCLPGQWSWRMI